MIFFFWGGGCGPWINRLDFGDDPDPVPESGSGAQATCSSCKKTCIAVVLNLCRPLKSLCRGHF